MPEASAFCLKNFKNFVTGGAAAPLAPRARTPMDVVLSVPQIFVPHFAMSAFACIFTILYNRTNKQPDLLFEFFSNLMTQAITLFQSELFFFFFVCSTPNSVLVGQMSARHLIPHSTMVVDVSNSHVPRISALA